MNGKQIRKRITYKQWQDNEKAEMGDKLEEHNKIVTQRDGKPFTPAQYQAGIIHLFVRMLNNLISAPYGTRTLRFLLQAA